MPITVRVSIGLGAINKQKIWAGKGRADGEAAFASDAALRGAGQSPRMVAISEGPCRTGPPQALMQYFSKSCGR
jgi:hypothetical protein